MLPQHVQHRWALLKYGHLWHTPMRMMLIGPVVWMPLLIGLENLVGSLKYHQEWHTYSLPQHAKFQIHCWITWIAPRDFLKLPHVLEEVAILAQGVRRVPPENRLSIEKGIGSSAQLHRRGDGPIRHFWPSRRSGQGWNGWWWVPCRQIHSNPFDEDFRDVLSSLIEDEDVLMLFDDGDDGYSSDEGGGADDILHPRSLATEILGNLGEMANVVNLHPEEWFLTFKGGGHAKACGVRAQLVPDLDLMYMFGCRLWHVAAHGMDIWKIRESGKVRVTVGTIMHRFGEQSQLQLDLLDWVVQIAGWFSFSDPPLCAGCPPWSTGSLGTYCESASFLQCDFLSLI